MFILLLLLSALAAIGVWELRAIRKNMMTRNDMPHWFKDWQDALERKRYEEELERAKLLRVVTRHARRRDDDKVCDAK